MKNVVVTSLLLLAALLVAFLLTRDPGTVVRAQDPKETNDLAARLAEMEEFISLHSHERELQEIRDRIRAMEASATRDQREAEPRVGTRSSVSASRAVRTPPNRELATLKRDVQSLSSKLSSLERMLTPVKQDIAKLKLGLSRLESSVAGIDLRR